MGHTPVVITGWHRSGVSKLVILCYELSLDCFQKQGQAPPLFNCENLSKTLCCVSVSSFVNEKIGPCSNCSSVPGFRENHVMGSQGDFGQNGSVFIGVMCIYTFNSWFFLRNQERTRHWGASGGQNRQDPSTVGFRVWGAQHMGIR